MELAGQQPEGREDERVSPELRIRDGQGGAAGVRAEMVDSVGAISGGRP